MKSFISEDNIEQAICNRLSLPEYGWKRIECDARVEAQDDVSTTGRANPSECILPDVLFAALKRLNPKMDEDVLKIILQDLRKDFTGTDMVDTNYSLYQKIRNGIKVHVRRNGKDDFDIVRLFDFDHPEMNDFHCVNQMWIKGHYRYRRPDVLLFVNGLPIVFIELKNSTVKIEESYNKNLTSYRQDIPNIFAFNQICVLSNGLQTKIGAWNSKYEFFFEWLRVDDEKEKLDREQIAEHGLSIQTLIDGLFRKERLLDYIENFVFFDNKRIKIIAKNHQYLGVNNLMESVKNREKLNGKLGVFWHTQGSGKSYSMVMFVRKVRRKLHGNLGKGMVVSVDKYTAVRMYDKVQKYWAEEKKTLVLERNQAKTMEEREKINAMLDYMNKVEMAVVISKEDGEEEKFAAHGLDITKHRKKMEAISPDGKDIEDRFKDKDDPLSLVFVCAMWLTGFDVPSLSTLYLDKPMKGHTLMQAIARANRVFPGKTCGIIVDYVNVFKYMQQALSDYASTGDGQEYPAKDIERLIANIDQTITDCDSFLLSLGIKIADIIAENNTLDQLEMFRKAYNKILEKDEWKDRFKVLTNLLMNLYDAAKPEIFERDWHNDKFAPLAYLNGLFCNQIDDEKLRRAKARMAETIDQSVSSTMSADGSMVADGIPSRPDYVIHQGKVIDLSKIDVEALRKELSTTPYKALEIDDLRSFIEQTLVQMINKNCTRVKFSERYKSIIDRYNAGGSENEDYYEKLLQLVAELKKEQSRSTDIGLAEEELEIFDLLRSGRKLTKAEEQKVILAAKNLYQKLMEEKDKVMVVDWYKDEQPRHQVFALIQSSLNDDLPMSYDRVSFNDKTHLLFNHFVDMAVQGYGWVA